MPSDRPPRLRPVAPEAVDAARARSEGTSEAELLDRLEMALAALPAAERAAAVVAFGLDEGTAGVALELALSAEDADALTRSAVQLLRGALAEVAAETSDELYPQLVGRRRRDRPAADPPA